MKKLIITIFVLGLMTACQQPDLLISPEENSSVLTSDLNWLKLPASSDQTLNKSFHATKKIKCKKGGWIDLEFDYESISGQNIKGYAEIWLPKKAWDKNKYGEEIDIEMYLEDNSLVFTFLPHMDFEKNAELRFKIEGLDLGYLDDSEDLKFAYLSPDGTYQILETDRIKIDLKKGKIEVRNAQIPHFSRFGFLN